MDEFLRFIRTSSSRLFGGQRIQGQQVAEEDTNDLVDGQQDEDGMPKYVLTPCKHVTAAKWDELWTDVVEPKRTSLTSIVFINPNFARTFYVPQSAFRCGYDDLVEYSMMSNDLLATMKSTRYEQWMQAMVRTDACFVSLHVCQAAQLLERLCARCPNLVRLNFHFYYLDDHFVAFAVRHLPNVVAINLENSIGLSSRAYAYLGLLPKLAHINVSGCDISESGVARIIENCRQLESLNLSNNCLVTGQCLTLRAIKNIKRLNIRDCWRIDGSRLIEMTHGGLPNLFELICNSGVNDDSLLAIGNNCGNLMHLDISFEEFTYNDDTGRNLLTEKGFSAIAKLTDLRVLRLRHVGKLTDQAVAVITGACSKLTELTLNLRHRHKLTDQRALEHLAHNCPSLKFFEAVHNHFIGKHSMAHLGELTSTLKYLVLRGNELVADDSAAQLINKCPNLRTLILDGCPLVNDKTLTACIIHAQKIPEDSTGYKEEFQASLVCTSVDRSVLSELVATLPSNLRIRASDQHRNKEHYAEFDGKRVNDLKLRKTFFPFYWHDYN